MTCNQVGLYRLLLGSVATISHFFVCSHKCCVCTIFVYLNGVCCCGWGKKERVDRVEPVFLVARAHTHQFWFVHSINARKQKKLFLSVSLSKFSFHNRKEKTWRKGKQRRYAANISRLRRVHTRTTTLSWNHDQLQKQKKKKSPRQNSHLCQYSELNSFFLCVIHWLNTQTKERHRHDPVSPPSVIMQLLLYTDQIISIWHETVKT